MKNVMKTSILTSLTFALLLTVFSACKGVSTEDKKNFCRVSGSVSLSSSGAASSQVLSNLYSKARTATSSFEVDEETTSYQVYAYYGEGDSDIVTYESTPSITGSVTNSFYSVDLYKSGYWRVEVTIVDSNTLLNIASGSVDYYLDENFALQDSNLDVILYPYCLSDVTGSISLNFSDATTDFVLSSLTYSGTAVSDTSYEIPVGTVSFADGAATLELSDIPSGSYEMTFEFEDSDGNTLYSCREVVTVFSDFVTDTWYGRTPNIVDGAFTITDTHLSYYGTEIVPSTQMVLYNYDSDSSAYNFYLTDSADTEITSDTAADFSNSSTDFYFDADGNLYWYAYDSGTSYYKIYKRDSSGEDTTVLTAVSISGLTVDMAANQIYVYTNSEGTVDLYKYEDLSSGTIAPVYTIAVTSIDGTEHSFTPGKFLIYNSVFYASGSYTENYLTVGAFVKLALSDASTAAAATSINFYDECGDYSYITVNDMIGQDGAIYILYSYTNTEAEYQKYGGIYKYDTVFGISSVLETPSFTSGIYPGYAYGSMTSTTPRPFYLFDSDNNSYYQYVLSAYTYALYIPADTDLYLYGPKKIIAIKPKTLIIADDGIAYYCNSDGVYNYKNVNRVVTVDLESFAVTSTSDRSDLIEFESDSSAAIPISYYNSESDFFKNFAGIASSSGYPTMYYQSSANAYSETSTGYYPFGIGIPCGDE